MTYRGKRVWRVLAPTCCVVALLVAAAQAQATDFPVTLTVDKADDGVCNADCTIREAVERADANGPGVDNVIIPASAGTYTLSQGTIFANQPLNVIGAGTSQTRINAQPQAAGQQAIQFTGVGTNTIQDLTIQGIDDGGNGAAVLVANGTGNFTRVAILNNTMLAGGGGGLSITSADATLTDTTIAGNRTTGGTGGGGILVATPGSEVTIVNSTIANNSTSNESGGGIFMSNMSAPQEVAIRNSTISGNTTSNGNSAAIFAGGGLLKMSYNTIVGNTGPAGAGNGAILASLPGNVTLKGNIIQGNTPQNCIFGSNPVREGFNFEDANSCRLGTAPGVNANDHPSTPVTLGALADNGGPTQTHALPVGSAAIDAGGLGGCTGTGGAPALTTDQRGQPRPGGTACDSGAFEVQPSTGGGDGGGGGDGDGGGGGGGTDAQAPLLSLDGKTKQKLDGSIEVGASCDEACAVAGDGKLVFKSSGKGGKSSRSTRKFGLKGATVTLAAGEEGTLKLKVPKKAQKAGKKALRSGGKDKAKLTLSATDGAGNESAPANRTVTLKPPR